LANHIKVIAQARSAEYVQSKGNMMPNLKYKVVPAPLKGRRGSGVKGAEGRFANALEILFNEMAELGWTYERAETLPSVSRQGLFRRTVETYSNVLVFSRYEDETIDVDQPIIMATTPPLPDEPVMSASEPEEDVMVEEDENTDADIDDMESPADDEEADSTENR
jgi:hypothetical protein